MIRSGVRPRSGILMRSQMTRGQFIARLIPCLGVPCALGWAIRRGRSVPRLMHPLMSDTVSGNPLNKTSDEWQELVGSTAYTVLFNEGTERPFTSPLNHEKRAGTYVCAACFQPLFESNAKFDSGTGWPSFHTALDGRVATRAGSQAAAAAHRVPLRALRRPPGPRVQRRPGADRQAVLQQRGRPALRSGRDAAAGSPDLSPRVSSGSAGRGG